MKNATAVASAMAVLVLAFDWWIWRLPMWHPWFAPRAYGTVRPHSPCPIVSNFVIILTLFAAATQLAVAAPAGHALRRYVAEYQGSPLKATQFIEYNNASFATCDSLLNLVEGLNPKQQTTVRGCGIDVPAPDGSRPRANLSADDFYISYEEPALHNRATKTFTVYHISPQQMTAPEICARLMAEFHASQVNVRCHKPALKSDRQQVTPQVKPPSASSR